MDRYLFFIYPLKSSSLSIYSQARWALIRQLADTGSSPVPATKE